MEREPITDADQRKRRKIMREFKLSELSAVDRPAQIHARMTLMKRDAVRIEKEHTMPTFRTLDEAAAHYQRSGMSETLAKRTAASAHPELRYTTEREAIAQSEIGEIRKAAASGAARRQQIDDRVTSTCLAKNCDRQTALRLLRDSHPELFEDN